MWNFYSILLSYTWFMSTNINNKNYKYINQLNDLIWFDLKLDLFCFLFSSFLILFNLLKRDRKFWDKCMCVCVKNAYRLIKDDKNNWVFKVIMLNVYTNKFNYFSGDFQQMIYVFSSSNDTNLIWNSVFISTLIMTIWNFSVLLLLLLFLLFFIIDSVDTDLFLKGRCYKMWFIWNAFVSFTDKNGT